MAVVSNASPLIILSRIGRLSILYDLFKEIHITKAIYDEVVIHGARRPGSKEVREASKNWLRVHPTPSPKALRIYQQPRRLGPADASVLALAKELSAISVVIDDLSLRTSAQKHGLIIVGTGEILVRAKLVGLTPSVRELIEQAIAQGLRLGKPVKDRILKRAGELEEN